MCTREHWEASGEIQLSSNKYPTHQGTQSSSSKKQPSKHKSINCLNTAEMICVGSSLWSRNSSQYYAQHWSSLPHGTRRARFFWSPPALDVISPFVPYCFHIIFLLFIEIFPQTHLNYSQFKAAVLYSLLFYREDRKSMSLWAKALGFKQKFPAAFVKRPEWALSEWSGFKDLFFIKAETGSILWNWMLC